MSQREVRVERNSIGVYVAQFGGGLGRGSVDPVENIIHLAVLRFGVHDRTMTPLPGTADADTVLVDQLGHEFPMRDLVNKAMSTPPNSDKFYAAIMSHVDAVVAAADAPPPPVLTDEELLAIVWVRLVPDTIRSVVPVSYARPVSAGLLAVLCTEDAGGVSYLTDDLLVDRDVAALFNAGFRNVMARKLDSKEEASPGVWALEGSSVFAASKAIGMGLLVGTELPPAPYGVVFGVPHPHVLFTHVVTGRESFGPIGQLARLVSSLASPDAPDGPLSPTTFFWRDGAIEPIGFPGIDGKVHVMAAGRFGETIEEFPA